MPRRHNITVLIRHHFPRRVVRAVAIPGGTLDPLAIQKFATPLLIPPVMPKAGTKNQCDGHFSQDLNAFWCPTCPKAHKNPGAGTVVQAQLWYRDPFNTSNQTTSLSDAIEFCVSP